MPIKAGELRETVWHNWVQIANEDNGWVTLGTASNQTTFTYNKMDEIWARWNVQWTTNATNITTEKYRYDFQRDWWYNSTGTTLYNDVVWGRQNARYELTLEEKRERAIRAQVDAARATTHTHGPEEYPLDAYLMLAFADLEYAGYTDLTDEEIRRIEDGWQRGCEEHIERLRQAELRRMEREQREREQAEANRKAELLLLSVLTHEQKKEWMSHRRVTEVAPSGRVWRLFPEWSGGATIMEGEARRATLCIHPRERVPEADNMAALIMALRSGDEDHLIQIAILHGGHFTEEEKQIRAGRQVERVQVAAGFIEVPRAQAV